MLTYSNLSGKTPSTPRLTSGANTAVLLVVGQSNAANYASASLYAPTNATKIDNLSIVDGGTYRGSDPGLGCTGNLASWLFRSADLLINDSTFDRVILVPIAVGGTSITLWAPTGSLFSRISAAIARCSNVGLSVSAVAWQQGEADTSMAQATYAGHLTSIISATRALGMPAPWFIGKSTYNGGVTSPTVRAACAEVVNNVDIFAGADTDTLTGTTYREPSLVHFNEAGINAAAGLWRDALEAVF
ncbi:sialate O-acetylesterase [Agrobacterium rhizogenes]|nr:sialate O-acetylesterase [Rhizobium rhizogenes]